MTDQPQELREYLAEAKAVAEVICVRIPFVRIDGVRTNIPAYKLVEG